MQAEEIEIDAFRRHGVAPAAHRACALPAAHAACAPPAATDGRIGGALQRDAVADGGTGEPVQGVEDGEGLALGAAEHGIGTEAAGHLS